MRMVRQLALFAAICILQSQAVLGAEDDKSRQQFEGVVQGLNGNSFVKFHRAIDRKELTFRIYGSRVIEPEVKKAFSEEFSTSIEQMFTSSFPPSKKEILGTIIDFKVQGEKGRAVVRYAATGYRYSYHVYELQLDSKGRPAIVDWIDYYQGSRFSDEAGEALVMAFPSKEATRDMLLNKNLGEGQVFQVGELFKAARDNKPERFFQIYDGLDEQLLQEKIIVRLNWHLALTMRDADRAENAARKLVENFPDEPLHSLRLIEYYIPSGQFDKALAALERLQQSLGVTDGASESLKASAALAMGNFGDAEKYAVQATVAEPSLELAWWSLLRARTAAADYSGATEALAHLEDDFGHTLGPQRLRKDRFLKVLSDKPEYLDWRAGRE